jgi:surfactin synthase thioesterase subunit
LHEPAEKTFHSLAAGLCDELEINVSQRYALFGHSMGGLLAYEIAHCLRKRKQPLPVALLMSGCAAPSRQDWKRYAGKETDVELIAELRRQNGTPEEVFENPELLSMTLELLRTDYNICASFRYCELPPLPIPVHVFGGNADEIHPSDLEAWRYESTVGFSLDYFEGGHFFIRQDEEKFLCSLVRRLAEENLPVSGKNNELLHAALDSA